MRFTGRREDARLLTGRGRFTADRDLPGQVHGHFLRADRAHAEIAALRTERARAGAGVLAVFTGADLAHFGQPAPLVRYPGRDGMKLIDPRRDALATTRVRHVGEEIALVVAESAAAAQDAAEMIEIDYRDLPALVELDDARAPGAPLIHDAAPGNLAFDFEYGSAAATAEAFAKASHVARVTLDSQRLVGNPMEPKS
ncbi:MAG TPA: hypothetical protein VMB81_15205, partial [Candidatus Sulfotelmatobacter sp.]|nr:hypothetical protein [Candidatus Sulfotelmatobacter sp.]